jgi:hypothetical protein
MQVYNKSDSAIYYYSICVLVWVYGCLCHVMMCVPDPKMCIYTDNVCNQGVFWISFLQFVWQAKCETLFMQLVGKVCKFKYHICRLHNVPLQFSFPSATFPSILKLLIFFGTGLEVLRAMRIHSVVCVRTPCSLSAWLWMIWRSLLGIFRGHLKVAAVCLDWNLSTPIRPHGPITCNTVILNLNILHFPCLVSLYYHPTTCVRQ